MQDHATERRGAKRVALLLTLFALVSLLIAAFVAPGFVQASWSPTAQQDVEPDRGCDDATGAALSPEHCEDPCDDDLVAANGGRGDDDCEENCEDLLAASWGGPGYGDNDDDDECPLPCIVPPPAPTLTPTSTAPPAPTTPPTGTITATVTPTGTITATVTPTGTVPPAPTVTPTTTVPAPPTAVAAHGGGDDNDDRGGDERIRWDCETDEARARIVSLPVPSDDVTVQSAHGGEGGLTRDDFNGEWVIGDRTFTVTEDTILVTRYGRFEVGKCVEVTWGVENPAFALMIESKPDHKCSNPENSRVIWGAVTALPDDPNQVGVWTVGGISLTVTAETKFILSPWTQGPIELGDFVKVVFNEVEGERIAKSVHSIWAFNWGHGWWKWRMGRAFGPIESLPAGGGEGTWEIAGVTYLVTERTRLDDDEGAFGVGVNVKVEFFKMPDGTRVARKIESTHDTGGGNGDDFRFVGVVDEKPLAFVGDWTIGGAPFVADANTRFDESKGLLVVGAYVAVRYSITDDMRLATEIKTVIPPGGGGHKHFGRIERSGSSTMSAAAADGVSENVWRIGGQEFVVLEGTLLNDELSALEEGQMAYVDAYVETDGSLVATSIEGMSHQFLPMLQSQ